MHSIKFLVNTVVAIFFLVSLPTLTGAREVTVNDVIDLHIESLGGEETLNGVVEISTMAQMLIPIGDSELDTTMIQHQAGNKFKMTMAIPDTGEFIRGSDGETYWSMDPQAGPRLLGGEELEQAREQFSSTFPALTWKEFDGEITLGGTERISGRTAYKLIFEPTDGIPATRFIDKENGQILKIETEQESPQGTLSVEVYPSDYRTVKGVTIPHKQVTSMATGEMTMQIQSLRINDGLPEDVFNLPDEIKELVNQAETDDK